MDSLIIFIVGFVAGGAAVWFVKDKIDGVGDVLMMPVRFVKGLWSKVTGLFSKDG
jgi:hypothetical protein